MAPCGLTSGKFYIENTHYVQEVKIDKKKQKEERKEYNKNTIPKVLQSKRVSVGNIPCSFASRGNRQRGI